MEEKVDLVNNPLHYSKYAISLEPIDILEDLGFNYGNAFKYFIRSKDKGNELQDLKKAQWYIKRAKQRKEELTETQKYMLALYLNHAGIWARVANKPLNPDYVDHICFAYIWDRIHALEGDSK